MSRIWNRSLPFICNRVEKLFHSRNSKKIQRRDSTHNKKKMLGKSKNQIVGQSILERRIFLPHSRSSKQRSHAQICNRIPTKTLEQNSPTTNNPTNNIITMLVNQRTRGTLVPRSLKKINFWR